LPEPARQTEPSTELTVQALDAQVRLLPYALTFFALCLPVLLCTAAFAPNRAWLGLSLGIYAVNWTAFYAAVDWLKKAPEGGRSLSLRSKIQFGGSVLWAVAIAQTSWVAADAGPVSELLLILCAGAAAGLIFFSAPSLPALLAIGPAAAAGPVIGLLSRQATHHLGVLALSGESLALALGLILNRHLRGHFALAAEHERLLAEREAALARTQALARSKSDLLATLSSEIRNGLSGVTHVLAGALGGGPRRTPSREQLRAALDVARSLGAVLDAALDTENAEAGRLAVTAEPLDIPHLVVELVQAHRPEAAAKGLELISRIDESLTRGPGAVIGDPARARQALDHLLANAVKYTLRGRVAATVTRAGPDRLRIEIVDTGPGLSPAELALAFEPFRRVPRTGAGVPGAGLGLSLSRRLAELMGGRLEAESTPGVGSRFWLDLPFDAGAERRSAAQDNSPERSLRVLAVEPDALAAAMLRVSLEQLGHRVLLVADGARALELMDLGGIDLLVLDEHAGAETVQRIRALGDSRAEMPIVALIGGDPAEAEALFAAGADAALRKPVAMAAVARALADAQAARRPAHGRAAA
jgi:signal transduction histidine kinase/ActR/RegA family two-component response regulator